ncbi:AER291Cp [Eremothecium gossypii ATCC 10895]|uniref:AER291Cp n=1 Tax=Eremothecium gossypii (strain ATCC 10895 / CBS 109.51 / FGSC 9923 / NRRL Y-1056) TaxID=284811 RepID=Q756H5_EREGS|nr:AER291Cp [Eremothecium gossypii ATCC 10895]AAS52972.2 AER291Cp [Eremothecium gossypii ATCC 10895]AEY97280.1 FAER291Cp [Eremothecium gossypii FDAG1]
MNRSDDLQDAEDSGQQRYETYSCSRCRRLKKKCSKELPRCFSCEAASKECVYPGRAPRRTKKQLEEAIQRGEFVPSKKSKKQGQWASGEALSYDYQPQSPKLSDGSPQQSEGYSDSASNSRGNTLSSATSAVRDSSDASSANPVSSFLSILGSFSTTQQLGVGRNTGSVGQLETFSQGKLEHEMHRPDSIPITASSIQIEAVASVFKGGRDTPMLAADGTIKHIDRQLCDKFVAAYFKHNHRSYPLMNKIEFLNQVASIADLTNMEGKYENTFIFQLYMIMAIGCTTLQRAGFLDPDEEDLSEHFSYMAMRKFCSVMHLQNLETVKCLLLLGIYSFFEPKGISTWTISGLIMRLTIGLGLNRTLTKKAQERMSVLDIEMRYRAFWSFYAFERLVHTSLGRTSAIDDDDINVPLPRALYEEEREDIEVTKMMLNLRRFAGVIYKKVHSVSAGKRCLGMGEKQDIIDSLRQQLDTIYEDEKKKQNIIDCNNANGNISFHSSNTWLSMRYSQLMIMLYRPSKLIPKPSMDSLTILGTSCLEALRHTYCLYKKKLLPLNWITLFRTLTICNTMLYCLYQWSIDLVESKLEIQQCVEILQHFGEKWVFAKECAVVFQNIGNAILDISLSRGQVENVDKLTRELFGASNEYQDILDENNVDISWIDLAI